MPLPLIALAIGSGVVRTGVGIMQNRQETRRKRRLIREAYQNAAERLSTRQAHVREGTMESLAARGLLQGGDERVDATTEANATDVRLADPKGYAAAARRVGEGALVKMFGDAPAAPVREPRTLAGQIRSDTEHEFGLEFKDLAQQQRAALSDVRAASQQQTVNDIAAGVQTGVNVYGAGKAATAPVGGSSIGNMMGSAGLDALAAQPAPGVSQLPSTRPISPIASMMTGVDDPSNWFGGINGIDPFGGPGSAWNRGGATAGTQLGAGQTNAEFTV